MNVGIPNNMKSIPTAYGGCHFRSRLEARWAVYFDAIGWDWHYEPEGFELPNGIRYLPDFWFPAFDMYAEIKPESKGYGAFAKALAFSQTGKHILCLSGPPARGPVAGFKSGVSFGGNLMPFEWKYSPIFVGNLNPREMPEYDVVTDRACAIAKSARFEFGETPDRDMIIKTAKARFEHLGGRRT